MDVGKISLLFNDPVIYTAAILTILCICVLIIPVSYLRRDDFLPPIRFELEIPPQLKPDYAWDLTHATAQPEIRNGRIYPQCPADGRSLTTEPIIPATPKDIDNAINQAAKAQKSWAKTTLSQRRQLLASLLQHVIDHQEEIVQACCLDSGKTKIDACFGEILVTVEKLQWTMKHGEAALSPSSRPTNLLMCYKKNTVVYEPLGVVAACYSWNYPFHSWISNVISPLFSGNAVVLKPSEQTCWSSFYFLSIVKAALRVCGHDENLVQNVICLPDTADYLTSHPGLSHITFIGSKEVASKVCTSAAKALTPVCVELGGKDPAIVLDDRTTIRDIDIVTSIIMRGTFQSAGQNCIGIERIIALPHIHDLLVNRLDTQIKSLRLGSITLSPDPKFIDMGSMISSASFSRLENLISSAVEAGATLHTGGSRFHHPDYPHGHYFQPTLLSSITADMPIAQTELFGPVALVMKASSVSHAIELANCTTYGLGASVFGTHQPTLSHIARSLHCGMVAINDFGAFYATSMPFGGHKGSGYGRFSGEEGLKSLCNVKSICEDAPWARWLGIRTQIPPILQYPVEGERGWRACKGIIGTGYALSWSGRFNGISTLLGALMGGKEFTGLRATNSTSRSK